MKAMFHRVGSKIKKGRKGKKSEGYYIDDPNVIEYSLSKYQQNVTKDKCLQEKLRKKQALTQGRDDDELVHPPELADDPVILLIPPGTMRWPSTRGAD